MLEPIWNEVPETASRLRARIEAVLAAAQVAGHIDADRPNPPRWKGWLDHMLPNPRRIGERGHHPALPYADVPAFMARLRDLPGAASRALQFRGFGARATGGRALAAVVEEIGGFRDNKRNIAAVPPVERRARNQVMIAAKQQRRPASGWGRILCMGRDSHNVDPFRI